MGIYFYKMRQAAFDAPPPNIFFSSDVSEAMAWLDLPSGNPERICKILADRMREIKRKAGKMPPCVAYLGVTVREGLAKLPVLPKASDAPRREWPDAPEGVGEQLKQLKAWFDRARQVGEWESWIAPLSFSVQGDVVIIECTSRFKQEQLVQKFGDALSRCLGQYDTKVKK